MEAENPHRKTVELPDTAKTPPKRPTRVWSSNTKSNERSLASMPLAINKVNRGFRIPKKAPNDDPKLMSPLSQMDGHAQGKQTEESSSSDEEENKDKSMQDDGEDLEEGEVPESDEDISIVKIVKTTPPRRSSRKQRFQSSDDADSFSQECDRLKVKTKSRARRVRSSSSSSSSSRSRSLRKKARRRISSSSSSSPENVKSRSSSADSNSSKLVIVEPKVIRVMKKNLIDEKKKKKKILDDSVYSEVSPMPKPISVRCLDDLMPSHEPSPMPPEQPMDLLQPRTENPQSNMDEAEDVIDLNINNDDAFDSFEDEDIAEDDQDDHPKADESKSDSEEQPKIEEQPPTLSREEIGFRDCHPCNDEITRLIRGQVCLSKLEYGSCPEATTCQYLHDLNPEDVIGFYDILRHPMDHMLPPTFRPGPKGDKKASRLISIYQAQKEFLHAHDVRNKTPDKKAKSLQLMHYVLDDIKALLPPEHKLHYVCKTIHTDLENSYDSEEFKRNYLQKINVNEINDIKVALEKLFEIAQKILVAQPKEASDLAYRVYHYWLRSGLSLQPAVVLTVWEIMIQAENLVHLPYVTNYACERPELDRDEAFENRIWKTLSLILADVEKKKKALKVMTPTLMSLDLRFLMNEREKSLLQMLANTCLLIKENDSKIGLFVDRLRLFYPYLQKKVIILPPLEASFKDVSLENQMLGLITNHKWATLVDMFLLLKHDKFQDMVAMVQKLAEIVTEEMDDEGQDSLADQALDHFTKELMTRYEGRLLPVHVTILSQLASTLIIHMGEDINRALQTVVDARKYGLHPWKCVTFYNPEAESKAIKTRHNKFEAFRLCIKALLTKPEFVFVAWENVYELQNPWEAVEKGLWTVIEFFDLSKHLLLKMIETPALDGQKVEKMKALCKMYRDNLFPLTNHFFRDREEAKVKEIKTVLLNDVILELLGLLVIAKERDEQVTIVLPFVMSFYKACPLTDHVIRGLVHVLHQKEHMMALEFFKLGINSGIYEAEMAENRSCIMICSHFSHYEIQVIVNEAFKEIVRQLTEEEIRSLYLNMDDDPDLIEKIKYQIRVEKPDKIIDTKLRFLDVFNVTNVEQASQRVSQVLTSLEPPVRAKFSPKNPQTMYLYIDAPSLIAHLQAEFLEVESANLPI